MSRLGVSPPPPGGVFGSPSVVALEVLETFKDGSFSFGICVGLQSGLCESKVTHTHTHSAVAPLSDLDKL